MTTQLQETTVEFKQPAKTTWWILLIQGFATVILGLMLFGQPGKTLLVLTTFVGAFWLINGILNVAVGIMGRTEDSRIWTILGGVVAVLASLIVLNRPFLAYAVTTSFLTYLIAFAIIINGILQIFAGRISADSMGREWSLGSLIIGVLYVIGGLFLLGHQGLTAVVLLSFVAAWALITGLIQIIFAFRIKGAIS